MNDTDSIDPLEPVSRRALRHHVVRSLLKAIINGELTAGTRLITSRLAVRLGVSATPIREALVELEQSGVVELLHHRGAAVKPFGRKELRDFYVVRGLLESEAVRAACGHVEPELLHMLRCDLERLTGESGDTTRNGPEICAVDHRVHLMAVEHCSNKRLTAEIERYDTLGEMLRDIAEYDGEQHKTSMLPLVDLLDGMQQHKANEAAAAMRRHIDIVAGLIEAVLFDRPKDQIRQLD
jgi:DNA-binding GntR family transcriptional regulator